MFRLMLVTDRRDTAGRDLADVVRAAVDGGVDCVQVREKDLSDDDLLRLTERIAEAVAGRAAVVVNGRASVAEALGVGLHLAEPDPGLAASVRSRASRPRGESWPPVWGRSVHSVEGALRAKDESPSYLLLGTIYETTSKPGLEGSGVSLVRQVVDAVGPLPVLAIGGIDATNVADVMRAGASGVAVRSAVLRAADPVRAVAAILRAMG